MWRQQLQLQADQGCIQNSWNSGKRLKRILQNLLKRTTSHRPSKNPRSTWTRPWLGPWSVLSTPAFFVIQQTSSKVTSVARDLEKKLLKVAALYLSSRAAALLKETTYSKPKTTQATSTSHYRSPPNKAVKASKGPLWRSKESWSRLPQTIKLSI